MAGNGTGGLTFGGQGMTPTAGVAGALAAPECSNAGRRCNGNDVQECKALVWQTVGTVLNDAENCGTCGHSCLGGTCNAGRCSPVELATDQNAPAGIALDSTYVYYTVTRTGVVARVPKTGGPAPQVLASGLNWPRSIAVAGNKLYFSDGNQIFVMNTDGSNAPIPFYTDIESDQVIFEVVTDGSYLAWFSHDHVQMAPIGSSSVSRVYSGFPGGASAIGLGDGTLFFGALGVVEDNGWIRYYATDGSISPTSVAGMQDHPTGIAFDEGTVYWVNEGSSTEDGEIWASTYSNGEFGAPRALASGQARPHGILVDSNWVYWTNVEDGTVRRIAKSGTGNAQTLASNQRMPWTMAQDSTAIYWTNNVNNSPVMRLAK